MSLTEHFALIEQLKPSIMEPNFQYLFDELTESESNSTRFLLRMELSRLGSDCTRIIDLRDKSDLPCTEVRSGNQTHFLDAPAQAALEHAMRFYHGKYTMGVYEDVLESHRKRRETSRQMATAPVRPQPSPFSVKAVVLGNYFSRTEARMNYSMKIRVGQAGKEDVAGITTDLSIGGARIRIPTKHGFSLDKPLRLQLTDLQQEYYYDELRRGIEYQIVNAEGNGEYSWFRLKRLCNSSGISELLGKLIDEFKYRYKLDVNDVLVTATGLGFERHYLSHLPHLPLFVTPREGTPRLTHMLLSPDNCAILHHFQDEQGVSQLDAMLTPERISTALQHPADIRHRLLYCFNHNANGTLHFYSATLAELIEAKQRRLFFGIGSSRPSWRVFRLSLTALDHTKSYKNTILPGDSPHYPPLTEQQLAGFSHMVLLQDLTSERGRKSYRDWYDNANPNPLKVYGQAKLTHSGIRSIAMEFSERRRESRYSFKTQVLLQQGQLRAEGFCQDISSRGLQLILDKELNWAMDKYLYLSFPKLQPLAGKISLESLPYRVVRTRKEGMVLHLAAVIGHDAHPGVEFFNKLIIHNREKLEQLNENNSENRDLADGMKNQLIRHLPGVPLFVEKTTKAVMVSHLGINTAGNPISDLFAALSPEPERYNLAPLLEENRLKEEILAPISTMRPNDEMSFSELFVRIERQGQGTVKIHIRPLSALAEPEAQASFIKQSQQLGKFMALRLYRGVAGKTELGLIRRELEYIHIHAQHKAKQLEEQLTRLVGIGELLDITDEVLQRYPSTASA